MSYEYGNNFDNNEEIFDRNYIENLNNSQTIYYNEQEVNSYHNEEWDKKEANKLCVISLICFCLSGIFYLIRANFMADKITFGIISFVDAGLLIVALVLIICACVRYRKSVFVKVLLWLYIFTRIMPFLYAVAIGLFTYAICSAFGFF